MGKNKATLTERCQQLVEGTITTCSSDEDKSKITVVGDRWSEYLTSKTARVSLWAKLDRRGFKEVDMQDAGFLVCIQSLALKGPGEEDCYDGVQYMFQLYSEFD